METSSAAGAHSGRQAARRLSAELLSAADGIFNEINAATLGFLNWKRIGGYAH